MGALVISGVVLTITMFAIMARFGLRKFLGYAAIVDIAFTVLMFALFEGTFAGIVSGSFAGLSMTALLYILRWCMGYERIELVPYTKTVRGKVFNLRRLAWVYHPPHAPTFR